MFKDFTRLLPHKTTEMTVKFRVYIGMMTLIVWEKSAIMSAAILLRIKMIKLIIQKIRRTLRKISISGMMILLIILMIIGGLILLRRTGGVLALWVEVLPSQTDIEPCVDLIE